MPKHGFAEEVPLHRRRSVIRLTSGRVMVCAPIEPELDTSDLAVNDLRFVDRMVSVLRESTSSYFFVWEYVSMETDEDPRITVVFWDKVESIRPAYVDGRGDEIR